MVVEVARGGFVKRDGRGHVAFLSPVPCPFNYGSIPGLLGGDGDPLDAVLLGSRLPRGTRVRAQVLGVLRFVDAGATDDKVICGAPPLRPWQRRQLLAFFTLYVWPKVLLNGLRGHFGSTRVLGWQPMIPNEAPTRD